VSTQLEPLAVYDVHEPGWYGLSDDQRHDLAAWSRAQRIEPSDTFRLEIYLLDCPFARVFQFERDAGGHKYVIPGTREIACRKPFDVPVGEMPPVKPWSAS
jgi:hypothetical protein